MSTDLLLSLPITAVGYLLIPTLCSLLLKKDIGRGNQIAIVAINAVVIFALFTGLKFLGNGELTEGNAVAAIIWSYIGFIILKNKQSKLLINEEEDVISEKAPSQSTNKSKQTNGITALSFFIITVSILSLINAPKLGVKLMHMHFDNADKFSTDVAILMISEYINIFTVASVMLFLIGMFGLIYSSVRTFRKAG